MLHATIDREHQHANVRAYKQWDSTEYLGAVRVPTPAVRRESARGTRFDQCREIASGIPGARLVVVPGEVLIPTFGDQDREFALIDEFLGEPQEPTPGPAPSGFQTILFTDLEASTELTRRLGDEAAQKILRGHDAAVRAALGAHGGREVKHTGDGIMVSFPSPVSAVAAALQIKRDLAGGELRASASTPASRSPSTTTSSGWP